MRRAAGLLLVMLAASACSGERAARGVLLVTLDTTRADRIGCYGDAQAATPNLDRLATLGTRFDQAQSPAPITLTAHASIFTGTYPGAHGVRYNGMFRLPDGAVTLAERLRDAGWKTAAFPAAFPVAASTGLNQGFELYDDAFSASEAGALREDSERPASEVSRDAVSWIGGIGDARFFAWVHFYDPHDPYAPPEPYRNRFRGREYDGEIAYVDNELGRVFQALAKAGRWDDTLVIVVGDHGESLGEHGEPTHKILVYQSTLRVPLIVKAPGRMRGTVVTEPVSLVDLAPTVLEYAGLALHAGLEGISLKPYLHGASPPRRPLFFESLAGSLSFGWAPLDGVRRGPSKLIDGPGRELYDLERDPGERNDLAATNGAIADDLAADLDAARKRWQGAGTAAAAVTDLDRESRERLESLGYVGGGMTRGAHAGRNPREVAHLESAIVEGKRRSKAQDWAGALEVFRGVLREDSDNRFALAQAASAALSLRQFDEALSFARHQIDLYPDSVEAWQVIGDAALESGHPSEAAGAYTRAVAGRPADASLRFGLVIANLRAGNARAALREADAFEAADPGHPHPRIQVVAAAACARLGDAAGATRRVETALAQGFRDRELVAADPAFAPLRALPAGRRLIGR